MLQLRLALGDKNFLGYCVRSMKGRNASVLVRTVSVRKVMPSDSTAKISESDSDNGPLFGDRNVRFLASDTLLYTHITL